MRPNQIFFLCVAYIQLNLKFNGKLTKHINLNTVLTVKHGTGNMMLQDILFFLSRDRDPSGHHSD